MADEPSSAGKQLASLRRLYTKVCPICGSEFEGIAKRVYDKHACQVKAYRQRKKALSQTAASSDSRRPARA